MKDLREYLISESSKTVDCSPLEDVMETAFDSMQAVVDDLEEAAWDSKLPKKTIAWLFDGFEKCQFLGGTLSNNGYQGEAEDTFDDVFGDDYTEYTTAVDWDGNGCCGTIEKLIDKNGRLVIICDMDPLHMYISL